jgi:hypothetical protein
MNVIDALKILEVQFNEIHKNNGSLLNLEDTLFTIVKELKIPKVRKPYCRTKPFQKKEKTKDVPISNKKRKIIKKSKFGELLNL